MCKTQVDVIEGASLTTDIWWAVELKKLFGGKIRGLAIAWLLYA
jgi:hypothetical protein